MLKVNAVADRRVPIEGQPSHYVGYRKLDPRDVGKVKVAFVLGDRNGIGGASFATVTGPVEVPDSVYYRRALRRGDLTLAVEATKTTKKSEG